MAFEAYSVAVKLSLINHVSAGMALISKSLASTGQDVDKLNAKLASIGKQGAIGGAMVAGGLGIAALFKAPIDAAKQYELAYTKFKTINLGGAINAQADNFARSANVLGVSAKDLMNSLSESVGLFGDFDLAKKLTPKIAALNAANSAIFAGKVGHIDEGSTRSLLKFIDRRGGTHDEATFLRNLDLAQRMVTGSGGFVKFRDLDQFSQMGGTAFRGLSDEGIYNMSLLLQEQGGAKAGTSLMSGYQNLIAGRTPKKTMALLQEFGLGTLAMETHGAVGGKPLKAMVMKNIVGADVFQANPAEWIRAYALPAAAKHGITNQSDILKFVNDIFSNRTASNQNSIISTQQLQLIRDANLTKGAMGADQTIQAYKDDPNSKFADLRAKWNGLMINIGIAVLPLAIRALEKITPLLISAANWVDKNRESVKNFGLGLAIFSGFLIGGGLINMTIAAGRGFWLLAKALIFVGTGGLAPLIPWIARMATYLVMGATGFAKFLLVAGRFLLLNPIGLVITAIAAAAFLLWNNWKEISGALKLMWSDMKTGFVQLFSGDIVGAFKLFALVFLTGWQTIFNTLIAGANTILPASWQISKTTFADDYRKTVPGASAIVAPVPPKDFSRDPIIVQMNLDGKRVAEVVVDQMTKTATKPRTGTQGFDPTRTMLMPGTPSTAIPRG
ncbi:phage tail tape measure protein [Pseudomonas costantinii]|uniref:Phage tail tape measure protein n=1 Tax=Pseudomonas costantinii TaxID=168469 RepID=A0A1S2UDL3_9PSED|nr:hypothetical protein [Pseudomonas costantinii]OIN44507.1 hypothetical protein BFL40_29920 [Pseudomonas costantinii]SED26354.1 hypothetical protein SAMN04515675_0477 [Pseudomonas costantinii]